jgi:CRP-like cAMP-binding protein
MDLKELTQRFPTLGSHLEAADVPVLEKAFPMRVLTPGEILVAEGDHLDACWLLWDGKLAVSLRLRGRTLSLGRFDPGAIVGEVAFSDSGPATATVSASTPCLLFEVKQEVLERLCVEAPRIASGVLESACKTMATHLKAATDRLESLRADSTSVPELMDDEGSGFLDGLRHLFGLERR